MMDFYNHIMTRQLVGAHRGHRAYFPENTLIAFEDCIGNCDYIEIDIQFTADGIAVVFHDENLKRTSNALSHPEFQHSDSLLLSTFNYSQLQNLDIGSWFYQQDPFNTQQLNSSSKKIVKDQSQSLLTLDALLEFISTTDLGLNIEIKSLHKDSSSSINSILESINNFNLQQACIISSFNHSILQSIKLANPCIRTAALVEKKNPNDLVQYLKTIAVDGYHIDDSLVDQSLFNELSRQGYFCSVYTINSKIRIKEIYKQLKTGSIITDYLY